MQWSVVIVAATIGVVTDLRSRRIPNWLTLPVFLGGVLYAFTSAGWSGLGDSIAAAALLMLPFVVLFALGGGAGDAKLMAAIGAWLGLAQGVVVLVAVAAAGILAAMAYAVLKRKGREVAANLAVIGQNLAVAALSGSRMGEPIKGVPAQQQLAMPYGVAIFIGVCVAGMGVYLWRT